MNRGIWYAVGAYVIWGFFPLYFRALQAVPPAQILANRVVWSLIFLVIVISLKKDWIFLKRAILSWRTLAIYFVSACLLAVNWLTYIWGVNNGFVLETSLGYFINPLVSVLLGVVFLREKLRPVQWIPVVLATLGVAYLTINYGSLPWIALVLAFTFGVYGLVKKTAPLGALHGLTIETGILFLPLLAFMVFVEMQGSGAFGNQGVGTQLLLVSTGVGTALPLLMFATAARRISLSTLGILQYIAPTLQFLLGVYVFGEPFTHVRLVGFSLIWSALILYTVEGMMVRHKAALASAGT